MKNPSSLLMKIAVGLTILFGVLLILFANEKSFKKIIADDIQNISKLSASIIFSEIDNSLTKPIFVGQTMANDLFLKNWLAQESAAGADSAQMALMQQYLFDYAEKYGYDSVAVTSAKSGVYYYQEGINKVISHTDAHDVWFYDFIESGEAYKLVVDTDEANNNELTVFIDSRVVDRDGSLLGVVGVGIKMLYLQELLQKYETEYDLRAFLIDRYGLVQVDTVGENIEKFNFFDTLETQALKDKILNSRASQDIFWYTENGSDHCLITKYVANLDWYIVIEKNTARTQQLFTAQINRDLLFIGILILLVLLMISYIIAGYNRRLLRTASLDEVTNLPNYKMFQEIFRRNNKRSACREGVLFLFDIDRFKAVNDQHGHLFGNTMLYRISEVTKAVIGNNGLIARWGGDEFVGVLYGPDGETGCVLEALVSQVSSAAECEHITISLGATRFRSDSSLDTLLREADSAMYRSKEKGGCTVSYFSS